MNEDKILLSDSQLQKIIKLSKAILESPSEALLPKLANTVLTIFTGGLPSITQLASNITGCTVKEMYSRNKITNKGTRLYIIKGFACSSSTYAKDLFLGKYNPTSKKVEKADVKAKININIVTGFKKIEKNKYNPVFTPISEYNTATRCITDIFTTIEVPYEVELSEELIVFTSPDSTAGVDPLITGAKLKTVEQLVPQVKAYANTAMPTLEILNSFVPKGFALYQYSGYDDTNTPIYTPLTKKPNNTTDGFMAILPYEENEESDMSTGGTGN